MNLLKEILSIHAKNLFPEVRNVVDLAFGSPYPIVDFTYVIADPWGFYLKEGIYYSPKVYHSYTDCVMEMLKHCKKLISDGKL